MTAKVHLIQYSRGNNFLILSLRNIFFSKDEYKKFLGDTPTYEHWMVESGIQLIKYWVDISIEEKEIQ